MEVLNMNAAIYSNIGTGKSRDTEEQLTQLRVHLRSQRRESPFGEVYLFVDRDLGKTDARPQFQELLASASHGDFQVLLVWALDRCIGQSVAETFANVKKLVRYGVHLISFTEPYFCTGGPAGAMIIPIAEWFTQQASLLISERTKAGLQAARAKGTRLGRPAKVFPRERAAADRALGLSWRQLEQKYEVPQATIRNAVQELADVSGLPPGHAGQSLRTGPKGRSR